MMYILWSLIVFMLALEHVMSVYLYTSFFFKYCIVWIYPNLFIPLLMNIDIFVKFFMLKQSCSEHPECDSLCTSAAISLE